MVQASPIPNHLSCSSYLWPSAHQNKKEKMVDSTERRKFLVLWVISYNFLCCECFAVSEENSFLIVLYASHLLHLSIPLFTVLPLNMLWQTFIFVACHSTYFYVRGSGFFFPVFLFSPCVLVFLFVHKSLYTMPMLKQIIPYAYLYHLVSCAMRSYTLPSPQVFAQSNLPKWIQRITKCREQSLWLFMCGFAVLQCMCFVHNSIRKSSQIFYLSIYLRWWMSTVLLLVRIILSHFIAYISLCGIFRVWPFFSIFLFLFAQVFFSARGGRANIHCRIPSILICESVSIFIVYTFAFITLLLYG